MLRRTKNAGMHTGREVVSLTEIAKNIRRTIIGISNKSRSPHTGSCLSCADILTVLYFEVLRLEPWNERDIFILSKGHAAMSLYSVLAERGILHRDLLEGYYQNNGTLPAHLFRCADMGIEVSTGSLGHGFNVGLGMAYGYKKRNQDRRVYALIGDGECQEGSIWEGALFASKLGLSNFTAIIDYNNLQGYGRPNELCSFEPLKEKWESFGWYAIETDGHDYNSLSESFAAGSCDKPKVIIAKTIKGKGISFMEDQLVWHYYIVTDEHKVKAMRELI